MRKMYIYTKDGKKHTTEVASLKAAREFTFAGYKHGVGNIPPENILRITSDIPK